MCKEEVSLVILNTFTTVIPSEDLGSVGDPDLDRVIATSTNQATQIPDQARLPKYCTADRSGMTSKDIGKLTPGSFINPTSLPHDIRLESFQFCF